MTTVEVLVRARDMAGRYGGWFSARAVAGDAPVELAERALLASGEFEAAFAAGAPCRRSPKGIVTVHVADPAAGPPEEYLCPRCGQVHPMRGATLVFRRARSA